MDLPVRRTPLSKELLKGARKYTRRDATKTTATSVSEEMIDFDLGASGRSYRSPSMASASTAPLTTAKDVAAAAAAKTATQAARVSRFDLVIEDDLPKLLDAYCAVDEGLSGALKPSEIQEMCILANIRFDPGMVTKSLAAQYTTAASSAKSAMLAASLAGGATSNGFQSVPSPSTLGTLPTNSEANKVSFFPLMCTMFPSLSTKAVSVAVRAALAPSFIAALMPECTMSNPTSAALARSLAGEVSVGGLTANAELTYNNRSTAQAQFSTSGNASPVAGPNMYSPAPPSWVSGLVKECQELTTPHEGRLIEGLQLAASVSELTGGRGNMLRGGLSPHGSFKVVKGLGRRRSDPLLRSLNKSTAKSTTSEKESKSATKKSTATENNISIYRSIGSVGDFSLLSVPRCGSAAVSGVGAMQRGPHHRYSERALRDHPQRLDPFQDWSDPFDVPKVHFRALWRLLCLDDGRRKKLIGLIALEESREEEWKPEGSCGGQMDEDEEESDSESPPFTLDSAFATPLSRKTTRKDQQQRKLSPSLVFLRPTDSDVPELATCEPDSESRKTNPYAARHGPGKVSEARLVELCTNVSTEMYKRQCYDRETFRSCRLKDLLVASKIPNIAIGALLAIREPTFLCLRTMVLRWEELQPAIILALRGVASHPSCRIPVTKESNHSPGSTYDLRSSAIVPIRRINTSSPTYLGKGGAEESTTIGGESGTSVLSPFMSTSTHCDDVKTVQRKMMAPMIPQPPTQQANHKARQGEQQIGGPLSAPAAVSYVTSPNVIESLMLGRVYAIVSMCRRYGALSLMRQDWDDGLTQPPNPGTNSIALQSERAVDGNYRSPIDVGDLVFSARQIFEMFSDPEVTLPGAKTSAATALGRHPSVSLSRPPLAPCGFTRAEVAAVGGVSQEKQFAAFGVTDTEVEAKKLGLSPRRHLVLAHPIPLSRVVDVSAVAGSSGSEEDEAANNVALGVFLTEVSQSLSVTIPFAQCDSLLGSMDGPAPDTVRSPTPPPLPLPWPPSHTNEVVDEKQASNVRSKKPSVPSNIISSARHTGAFTASEKQQKRLIEVVSSRTQLNYIPHAEYLKAFGLADYFTIVDGTQKDTTIVTIDAEKATGMRDTSPLQRLLRARPAPPSHPLATAARKGSALSHRTNRLHSREAEVQSGRMPFIRITAEELRPSTADQTQRPSRPSSARHPTRSSATVSGALASAVVATVTVQPREAARQFAVANNAWAPDVYGLKSLDSPRYSTARAVYNGLEAPYPKVAYYRDSDTDVGGV